MFLNKMAMQEFSKYEKARIIGARSLQISMDAPLLVEMSEEELNGVNYDPLKIAEKELNSGVLPISVKRPMPGKIKEKLKAVKEDKIDDTKIIEKEKEIEKEIREDAEEMGLVNSDESSEEGESS